MMLAGAAAEKGRCVMHILPDVFSGLATVCIFISCALYFRQTIKNESTPNLMTWLVFVFIAVMNTFTYYSVVGGDVVKTSMVVIHTSMLLLIFLYTAWKRKFTETRMVDVFCILLAIAVGVFWKLSDNDDVTNVLLQIIIVISTVPTIIGLQDGRGREKAISWFFAVSAYVFLSGSLIVDPETEGWVPYTYPFLRGLMCIGVIVSLKKRCRK